VLALAIGCQPAAVPAPAAARSPDPTAPAPPRSASPALADGAPSAQPELSLPAVERARLEYALQSAKLLGQDWPWMRADETCVLLIAPTAQWVANCPSCPEKFAAAGAPLFGKPVCAHAGDTLSLAGQTLPTASFVRSIPATANVSLPSDDETELGSDHPWLIASSLDALIGSHPAFDANTTSEEWLSIFLHEFFHTRQMLVPSFRPTLAEMKTGKLDPGALEKAFKEDAEYRSLVEQEYQGLSAAASDASLSREAARTALSQWSTAYERRRTQLQRKGGDALVHADVAFTYVEGTARYVEARFSSVPQLHAAASYLESDPHFHQFQTFPPKPGYEGLPQRKLGPRYYYAIGLHLSLLLDRADPSWKERVSEQPEWIVGLARDVARPRPAAKNKS
jgi:hypothetical protein